MPVIAHCGRARLRWAAQQGVDLDGTYDVYAAAADGESVDFEAGPINPTPLPAWPSEAIGSKVGMGLGQFGQGAFGYGHGGAGDGGPFGAGPFGLGTPLLELLTGELADGTYKFAVAACDAAGNADTDNCIEAQATIAGPPAPPGMPSASEWDDEGGLATLTWALSSDDE